MTTVTIDCPHCEEPIECEFEHGHEEHFPCPHCVKELPDSFYAEIEEAAIAQMTDRAMDRND